MKKAIAFLVIVIVVVCSSVYTAYEYKEEVPCQVKNRQELSIFKDKNAVHLSVASKFGIEPLVNRDELKTVKSRLQRIESNELYIVDRLTHSVPYLTKGANELLNQIARNFQDSLRSRGYERHRIIVTSVLRTQNDVLRLRKSGNKNATMHSAHMYATTIDITYARFDRMFNIKDVLSKRPDRKTMHMILAEVLKDLKLQRKCYVMYELGQRCFHITSRIDI